MADIFHKFIINAPINKIFDGISLPAGLDTWWTKKSSGKPKVGEEYTFWFGPEYEWKGVVSKCTSTEFEFLITKADSDWSGTKIGFDLRNEPEGCQVNFHHKGWPHLNDHFRTSSYCWAMYLRLLKQHLEHGLFIPYENRLKV